MVVQRNTAGIDLEIENHSREGQKACWRSVRTNHFESAKKDRDTTTADYSRGLFGSAHSATL